MTALLSTILGKATVALGAIVAFLMLILKIKNNKIEKQDRIIETQEKKNEIIEDMHLAEIAGEAEYEETVKNIDPNDWRGNLND